jgi:hypothetical protein
MVFKAILRARRIFMVVAVAGVLAILILPLNLVPQGGRAAAVVDLPDGFQEAPGESMVIWEQVVVQGL